MEETERVENGKFKLIKKYYMEMNLLESSILLEKEVIRQRRKRRRAESLIDEKKIKNVNGYSRKIKHKLQFSLN